MRDCYLISRSLFRILDLRKSRDYNFLLWVHFVVHSILCSKFNGWLRFKEGGYKNWIKHFEMVDEKGINEIKTPIRVFLDGILSLKIRSGKIRFTFVESNIGWDKKIKFRWWMIALVSLLSWRISYKSTFDCSWIQFSLVLIVSMHNTCIS